MLANCTSGAEQCAPSQRCIEVRHCCIEKALSQRAAHGEPGPWAHPTRRARHDALVTAVAVHASLDAAMQRAAVPQGRASSAGWRAPAFARLAMRDGPGGGDAQARAAMSHSRPGLARGPQRRVVRVLVEEKSLTGGSQGKKGGYQLDRGLVKSVAGRERTPEAVQLSEGTLPSLAQVTPNRISRCDRARGAGRGQPWRPSNGARLRTWRRSRWWTLRLAFGAGRSASRRFDRTISDR